MAAMNISLPEPLKQFVDAQVEGGSYGASSDYVRMLICREQDRADLREKLLEGARSPLTVVADGAYFDRLRRRARGESDE